MFKHYLIDWLQDWSDEFDLAGFEIVSKEELETLIEELTNCNNWNDYYEFYFGTNEFQMFTIQEILDILDKARPLTQTEYDTITNIFGEKYGITFCESICIQLEQLKPEEYDN